MAYLARGFIGIACLILLAACVPDQDMININDQLIALNKRVTTLEQSQGTIENKLGGDLDNKLKAVYSNQSEIRLEMDRLKSEFSKLTSRVEDNENMVKRSTEKDLTGQDLVKADLTNLSNRVKELEAAVKKLEDETKAQPTANLSSSSPENPKDEELYNNTLNLFKNDKIDEALNGFKSFLEKFPKSDLAGNAQFWIGECYMHKKQYDLAILAYQDVVKNYPSNNKIPNAILRQGVAAEQYGDIKLARALYKKVVEKFPNSNEAKTASERLTKLK